MEPATLRCEKYLYKPEEVMQKLGERGKSQCELAVVRSKITRFSVETFKLPVLFQVGLYDPKLDKGPSKLIISQTLTRYLCENGGVCELLIQSTNAGFIADDKFHRFLHPRAAIANSLLKFNLFVTSLSHIESRLLQRLLQINENLKEFKCNTRSVKSFGVSPAEVHLSIIHGVSITLNQSFCILRCLEKSSSISRVELSLYNEGKVYPAAKMLMSACSTREIDFFCARRSPNDKAVEALYRFYSKLRGQGKV